LFRKVNMKTTNIVKLNIVILYFNQLVLKYCFMETYFPILPWHEVRVTLYFYYENKVASPPV
jgi:hypothetical protein